MKFLWIGIGGFIGSVLRYLVAGWAQESSRSVSFPYGTLVVNIAGCLLIGALSYLADARGLLQAEVRLFLFVGVLGGFTTFSTFGLETLNLLRDGELLVAILNVSANVVLCLAAVWAGRAGAIAIWR
ncbi:MAG TPA: fluoride efflux transporter CrcB [Candidatus Krumholzibacteria bacterium]|nr:fluoride efflux transporter CrcB [Candidatus Krumholzibacteria bacterium]